MHIALTLLLLLVALLYHGTESHALPESTKPQQGSATDCPSPTLFNCVLLMPSNRNYGLFDRPLPTPLLVQDPV